MSNLYEIETPEVEVVVLEDVKIETALILEDELSFENVAKKKDFFISKIESVIYVDENSFTTIKELKKNFNSKRLEIYNNLILAPQDNNKKLLEIENALKQKEQELAKKFSEELKSTITARTIAVNEMLSNSIDKLDQLLNVEQIGSKINEMISKFIFTETKSGEIKFVKGNWDDKLDSPKASKLVELATEINDFNLYFELGDIGKTKYLNTFNYIESLNFEKEQRRIIEEENARKELEKVKTEEEKIRLEKETQERVANLNKQAVRSANTEVVVEETKEEVVISKTTKIEVEIDNSVVEQFKEMLNNNNITWKEVE